MKKDLVYIWNSIKTERAREGEWGERAREKRRRKTTRQRKRDGRTDRERQKDRPGEKVATNR